MALYIAQRLAATIPVLAVVAAFVFMLIRLTPGDPAAAIAGDSATTAQIEAIRTQLGLEEPIVVQFWIWLGNLARGDLGQSFFFRMDVSELIAQRIEPTVVLTLATLLLSVVISLPLGLAAARWRGGWVDRTVMGLAVAGFSVPSFVVGYVLIYVFAAWLGWLPVQGYRPLGSPVGEFLAHLILPTATLSFIYVALISRVTRGAVLDVMSEDFIRSARAKGLSRTEVVIRHALPNAANQIVTVIGIGLAYLIGGVVITETVFNVPGLGRLTVDAVLARDFPVIQGMIILFSLAYVAINLAIDLTYSFFDPRIRV